MVRVNTGLAALLAVILFCPGAAHAQGWFVTFFEEVALSKPGQIAIEEIAASGVAPTVLRELGIVAATDAEAAATLKSLPLTDLSGAMLKSDTFANMFRTQVSRNISSDFNKDAYTELTGAINTARAESSKQSATKTGSFLSLDALSGDLKLKKPFVVCENPWCDVEVGKLPVGRAAALAGGCSVLDECRSQMAEWSTSLAGIRAALNAAPKPPPAKRDWRTCGPIDQTHWCSLTRLDLTKVQGFGTYLVWNTSTAGHAAHVVRVGHGELAAQLALERDNPFVKTYEAQAPLVVSWVETTQDEALGIEKYLVQQYNPYLTTATSGDVTPIEVNLP